MNWADCSEIVGGLILTDKLSKSSVRPELFFPPYDKVIGLWQNGVDEPEDLIEQVGLSPVQACFDAAKSLNGLGDKNWVQILENSSLAYQAGHHLEKMSKKLKRGEIVDWSRVTDIATRAQQNTGGDFKRLSDIERRRVPLKKTGWAAIDNHLGGLPLTGQVIIGGPPGIGKTTTATSLVGSWIKTHKKDEIAIFTLEMMMGEFAMRFDEVQKVSKEDQNRIHINDSNVKPEEVISKAATIKNLGMVVIDFADLLIRGETNESSMAHIYRTFMLGAKTLRCPVVLLSQLNRQYNGGIPRPQHIRYTGLAEALAYMILMVYNPSTDYFAKEKNEDILDVRNNTAYLVCWKCRGGFRKHPEDSPGAIQVPFKGSAGWWTEHKGRWFSLKKLS